MGRAVTADSHFLALYWRAGGAPMTPWHTPAAEKTVIQERFQAAPCRVALAGEQNRFFSEAITRRLNMNDGLSPAERIAAEQANDVRRKLEHSTPAQLGWPGLSAEELIASEYRCWLTEEERSPKARSAGS